MATDCDDAGALAMLHGWANSGHVTLLAMGVSVINPYSILCLDAINTWYGRGTLPIGVTKSADAYTPNPKNVRFARQISEEYPRTYAWDGPSDAPNVVSVYRAALAAQPDINANHPGVVIITVGMLTNIRDLLQSGACAHSPLNGTELVQNKVRLWSCMAGHFSKSVASYNIRQHLSAARYAIHNWPKPLVLSPWEVGSLIKTGSGLQSLLGGLGPDGHILRRIYQLNRYLTSGRSSWDQCTCLYAVLGIDDGPAKNYWTLSDPGTITVHQDGCTTWAYDPEGLQQYKITKRDSNLIADEIESLMIAATPVDVAFPGR